MTPHLSPSHHPARSLLADEDVLGDLIAWRAQGLRTALVTLVAIDGNTPRPLGAQMAVAEDQRFSGYLSGGCIEQAIALEACQTIAAGQNRLVRYGKGSAYFDVQLPCGSGLDLYFDQGLTADVVERIAERRAARRPFTLVTDLVRGESRIEDTVRETACVLERRCVSSSAFAAGACVAGGGRSGTDCGRSTVSGGGFGHAHHHAG